jgi:hypothetical protein
VSETVIERKKVEEALAQAERWREEYVADGGADTAYLDGKIAALQDLLEN